MQQREWLVKERQQSWGQNYSQYIRRGHLVWQHRHGAVEQAGVEENDDSEVHLEEVVASVVVEGMEEEVHGPWVEAYWAAAGPGSHSAWVEERWIVRDGAEADVAKEILFQVVVVAVLVPSSVEALFPSLEAEAPVPSLEVPGQAWALSPCYSLDPCYFLSP